MIEIRCCVWLLLLALLLQGCSATRSQRHFQRAVAVLEQRDDADSLAASAVLSMFTPPLPPPHWDRALALQVRAVAAAPERPDLVWLNIQICREVPACDPQPEVDRLRVLDPPNGAAWLNAVSRGNAADDEAAEIAVLAELARSERVDIYWTTLISHLTRAVADTRQVSMPEALVNVIGGLAAAAIPAYSATVNLCKGERLNNDEVLQDCRRVALAFERGDTFITELIGLAIAQRVWPADSPEWQAAAEQRRVLEYRLHTGAVSEVKIATGKRWTEEYLWACQQNRREQDVVLADIIKAGKSPDPPPDWTSQIGN